MIHNKIKAWVYLAFSIALCLVLSFSVFNAQPVSATAKNAQRASVTVQNVKNVKGSCSQGYINVGINEALRNRAQLCNILGQWDIARLADGGSMDGPGYDCKIRGKDTRQLGNSLCKPLDFVVNKGDAKCPTGYTLASVEDVTPNQSLICNSGRLGQWDILRLEKTGSMDGPGYQCKYRLEDTRPLGGSLCVKTF